MRFALALFAAFLLAVAAAAQPPAPEQPGPCFSLGWGKFAASGVCVKSDGKRSLLVTNNHLFAIQPAPGADHPLGDYPLDCLVSTTDLKSVWKGRAIGGDLDSDLAVVVVEQVFAAGVLATKDAPKGMAIWHRGMGSGFARGVVLDHYVGCPTRCKFAGLIQSIPGDSGAGIFGADGNVVAINCGRHAMPIDSPERGTPATVVRAVLKKLAPVIPESLRP